MAFRVLLDAGILLDFTLQRKDCASARKLVEWAMAGRVHAFITPAILHLVAYWLTKEYGSDRAKEVLLTLLVDIQVIDIEHEATVNALHSQMTDIEDALQYYTAFHHKLDYFITRDRDLITSAIPILPACSPEEFIKNNA